MTKKSAEFIFQPGITGRFLGAGPLKYCSQYDDFSPLVLAPAEQVIDCII